MKRYIPHDSNTPMLHNKSALSCETVIQLVLDIFENIVDEFK